MADHVDDHSRGENEHIVFAADDVHAVSVGPTEPALADIGDDLSVTFEAIFVIEEIPLRFEVVRSRNVNVELAAEEGEQLLLHHGDQASLAFNFVGRPPRQQLLPDESQLLAARILKGKLVAPTERAAINEVNVAAILIP